MRIDRLSPDRGRYRARRDSLDRFADDLDAPFTRPCTGCDKPCPCSGSASCACACGPDCAVAAHHLSCDPHDHPIEAGIVPLVYAMATLRTIVPCWSCEGHEKKTGGLMRPPQVWFHARALSHVAVIDEFVQELATGKKLSCRWHVRSVTMGNRLDSTFALAPDLQDTAEVSLPHLRRDARTIAEELTQGVRALVDRFRADLYQVLIS